MSHSDENAEIEIAQAPPDRAEEALRLVFCHLSEDERQQQVQTLLVHARSGRVSLEGLLEARCGDRLMGAQFSQVLPGSTAIVWPPRVVPEGPAGLGGRLLEADCRRIAARGIRAAHALLENVTEADDAVLRTGGFGFLTDLLYLVSLEDQFPTDRPSSPLQFEPYCAANHSRLARVVEATYVDTRDCPKMNDGRDIEEILEGYRETGVFDPARWMIVRHSDRDVGCLLLADHPEYGNWELVYMGVVQEARGAGWGMDVTRHGQWLTGQAGRPRLVLAVDAENGPAIAAYASVGFQAWDRRSVYFQVF